MQGYRKRPGIINVLGAVYFFLPFLTLLQFYWQLKSLSIVTQILFSDAFLMEVFLSFSAGLAVLSITSIGFLYFLALSFYILSLKLYYLFRQNPFEAPLDFVVAGFWLVTTLLLLFSTLRIPYLNPKTKWWKQASRHAAVSHGILFFHGFKFPVIALNLSEGGVFLKLDERILSSRRGNGFQQERRKQIPIGKSSAGKPQIKGYLENYPERLGEKVRLQLEIHPKAAGLFPGHVLQSNAEIVWTAEPDSPYHFGLGLKFKDQTGQGKHRLQEYLKFLKKSGLVQGAVR